MQNYRYTALAAGALASAALGLAGTANAAPGGPSSVDATISELRAQGYQVIVNRIGCHGPVHGRCGPARTDVLAHRLRGSRRR